MELQSCKHVIQTLAIWNQRYCRLICISLFIRCHRRGRCHIWVPVPSGRTLGDDPFCYNVWKVIQKYMELQSCKHVIQTLFIWNQRYCRLICISLFIRCHRRGRCHIGNSPMVSRQAQAYEVLCTFMIAWVPVPSGRTLGDDPFSYSIQILTAMSSTTRLSRWSLEHSIFPRQSWGKTEHYMQLESCYGLVHWLLCRTVLLQPLHSLFLFAWHYSNNNIYVLRSQPITRQNLCVRCYNNVYFWGQHWGQFHKAEHYAKQYKTDYQLKRIQFVRKFGW